MEAKIPIFHLYILLKKQIFQSLPKSSTGHLQDPVVERLRDQIMEHYRYVNGMSAKQAFSIKISNTSKLYLHASQYLTVSSSSENFSQNIVVKAMI